MGFHIDQSSIRWLISFTSSSHPSHHPDDIVPMPLLFWYMNVRSCHHHHHHYHYHHYHHHHHNHRRHCHVVVVVTLFSNMIHEQNISNANLTNKSYSGYCKHVLCWRPPEKALAYLAGGNIASSPPLSWSLSSLSLFLLLYHYFYYRCYCYG